MNVAELIITETVSLENEGVLTQVLTQAAGLMDDLRQGTVSWPRAANWNTTGLMITMQTEMLCDDVPMDLATPSACIVTVSKDSRYLTKPTPRIAPYPSVGNRVLMIAPVGRYKSELAQYVSWGIGRSQLELVFGVVQYSAQTGYYEEPFREAIAKVYIGGSAGIASRDAARVQLAQPVRAQLVSSTGKVIASEPVAPRGQLSISKSATI